ncbi:hypothetical protein V5799_033961 [Amblyomma americanum]|uniref:Peptidase M13 N-terminal domain-containing protein n=1 Tax=Amblyomma americanum TaxID=6943 RepID=A0AAQ4DLU3_AMBAM
MAGRRGPRDRSQRRSPRRSQDRSAAVRRSSTSPRRHPRSAEEHRGRGRRRRSSSKSQSSSHSSSRSGRGRRLAATGAIWLLAATLTVVGGVGIGTLAVGYADFFQRVATPAAPSARSYHLARRQDADGAYMDSPGFIKNKGADSEPVETCDSDVCLWEGRNLFEKFNESVNPCNDFYGYVCGSTSWYRADQRIDTRPYRVHSPGQLMYDLADLQRRLYRLRRDRYRDQPTLFSNQLLFFLSNCTQPEKNESVWVTLKTIFEQNLLEGWPFKKDPKVLRISDTAMVLDKFIGLFAFVKVTLRKDFEEDDYEVHLEAPELLLKRHQLVFPNESVADYAKRVERLMSTFTDASMVKAAEDIVQLEQRLLQIKVPNIDHISLSLLE